MLRAFPKVYNARNIPAWNLAISSTFGFGQRSISTNSAINRSLRKSQYGSGRAEQRSPLRQSDGRGRIQPRARPLFARTPDRGSQEESMAPMRMRSSSTSIGLSRPQKKARHAPSMRHEGGRGGFSEDRGDYRKASMRSTRTNAKEHIPRSRIDSTNRSFRDHGLKESKYDYSPKLEGNRAARRAAQFGNKQDQPDSDPSMFQATRRAAIFGSNKDSPRKYQPEDTEQRAISNKFERTKRKDSVMPEDLQSDRDPPRRQWNSTAGSNEGGYERSKRSTNRTDDHYGHNEPRYGDRPSRSYEDDAPMTMPYTTPASEFLYGTSVVSAALRSGRRKLYKLYIYNGAQREGRNQDEKLEKLARQREVAIEKVQANWLSVMDRMSTGRPHNGYILEASPLPKLPVTAFRRIEGPQRAFYADLDYQSREDEAVNGSNNNIKYTVGFTRYPFVLLLDGILDPGNLGAIVRTAFFLGVDAIAFSNRNSAPFSPVTLKASAGAAETMPLLSISQPEAFLDTSKANGWKVFAAVAPTKNATFGSANKPSEYSSTSSLNSPAKDSPCVLMLGGEGEGLRWSIQKKAEFKIGIEGSRLGEGGVDSLNVSVAAGLLVDAFLRRPIEGGKKIGSSEEQLF